VNSRSLLPTFVAAVLVAMRCAPVQAPAGPEVEGPVLHEGHLAAADGAELPLRSWLPEAPPKAVLIALHGFNEYSKFFDGIGRFLAERGVASYAYDQRGFGGTANRGLWPGAAALASDLRAATTAVRARQPRVPLYVFGESMGAAVVMTTMARDDRPTIDGIILSAPAVWGRSSMPWYQTTALWLAVHTFPWSRWTGRGLGILASDNIEMLRGLGRDPMVIKSTRIDAVYGLVDLMDEAMASAQHLDGRMLVLYGEHDELIPPGAIREMLQRLPERTAGTRRFALYAEGWHMLTRDLQAEAVWRDIDAWITDADAPLPSGADVRGAEAGACPSLKVCATAAPAHSQVSGP
jgi:alpha-beta hydrolase superfamily lysophospholipase